MEITERVLKQSLIKSHFKSEIIPNPLNPVVHYDSKLYHDSKDTDRQPVEPVPVDSFVISNNYTKNQQEGEVNVSSWKKSEGVEDQVNSPEKQSEPEIKIHQSNAKPKSFFTNRKLEYDSAGSEIQQ